ncbi:MAG: hypothetical protein MUF51_07170 [Vicinamibacteria bacterium]|jgi:hypothetical protein|nr:hypothetical protein [Vicinamibacteria bacterium]
MLSPTPAHLMVDRQNRPYFLWDCEMTLDDFKRRLSERDLDVRAYYMGKLLRQAKPDDVFQFISLDEIRELWPRLERHLGKTLAFWRWLLMKWGVRLDDAR